MVSCLMGDSTALASAIVRCCLRYNRHNRNESNGEGYELIYGIYGTKIDVGEYALVHLTISYPSVAQFVAGLLWEIAVLRRFQWWNSGRGMSERSR